MTVGASTERGDALHVADEPGRPLADTEHPPFARVDAELELDGFRAVDDREPAESVHHAPADGHRFAFRLERLHAVRVDRRVVAGQIHFARPEQHGDVPRRPLDFLG